MHIPETNAFTINRLGASFFPLSLNVSQKGTVTSAFFCAQSVLDTCDVIEKYALEHLILFNIEQSSQFDEKELRPYTLEQVAASANIPCSAIDSESIVLAKNNLRPLLCTFSHNNLMAMDIGSQWNENEVIQYIITCREHNWSADAFILPKLPSARLFISSHDDCYLTIQTDKTILVQEIFTRMLQIYSGAILAENNGVEIDIADLPQALLTSFWEENFGLTVLRQTTEIDACGLKMGVAKKPFNFRAEDEYVPEFWIRYALQNQQWFIEK
jgi:hypothetical protein